MYGRDGGFLLKKTDKHRFGHAFDLRADSSNITRRRETMYKVLVSDPISDMGIQMLFDADDVTVDKKPGLSEDELVAIIGEYDALLVRSQTKVTAKIMQAGKKLKAV